MSGPLDEIARLLDDAGVRYAVIGAHAVNAWLEPRYTADVDVTAAMDPQSLTRLRDALSRAGYAPAGEHGDDLPSGPDFLRFRSADGLVVLEIQAAKTALQRELIARAVSRSGSARVATAEDLIVLKLIANRPKDRNDLLGLVRLPAIDWSYVERWAAEWHVAGLLAEVRRDAGRS